MKTDSPDAPRRPSRPSRPRRRVGKGRWLRVNRRELATILAALRFHQEENLQGGGELLGKAMRGGATSRRTLQPLSYEEVDQLCQRLNLRSEMPGLLFEPPEHAAGQQPLFRVVYIIDLHAANPRQAAASVHRILRDPESLAPALQVLGQEGDVTLIDLAEGDAPESAGSTRIKRKGRTLNG